MNFIASARGALLVAWGLISCIARANEPLGEREPFPQSARVVRDRRADAILESVRQQLQKGDVAKAVTGLQELLDGANGFVAAGSELQSTARTANRLLRELPPAARGIYERAYGAEAERLRQQALRSGRVEELRAVVTRFGQTAAGWRALNDLAARHADRGEWRLAAIACEELSRHVRAGEMHETRWLGLWSFALKQLGDDVRAADVLQEGARHSNSAGTAVPDAELMRVLAPRVRSISELEGSTAELLPFGRPVWQHAVGVTDEARTWRGEIDRSWRLDGVLSLPSSSPLVIEDLVVSRFALPARTVAVDVRQGKLLWERPDGNESLVNSATDLLRHPGFRESMISELQRRWFGDSIRGRLTSDGRRVFVVQDADSLDVRPGSGTRVRNHLAALDLKTGEPLWRVGGPLHEPPEELQGEYFLGPPLVSDGVLYAIGQRETVLRLFAIRADDGTLTWSLPIAETDRRQFRESGWRHSACEVTWSGCCLLCQTGAGCVVAVDPVTRSLAWSLAFERDDIEDANGNAVIDRDKPVVERWWQSWREGHAFEIRPDSSQGRGPKSESLTIVIAPESRAARGLNAQTGRPIWRTNFTEPILAAQLGSSPLLVFERHEVAIVDTSTGKVTQRLACDAPAAAGTWHDQRYIFSQRDGSWGAIDLRAAEARLVRGLPVLAEAASGTESLPGRVVLAADRWVSLSSEAIHVWEPLGSRRRVAGNLLDLAWATIQSGAFEPGLDQLRKLAESGVLAEPAKRALRLALLRGLLESRVDPGVVARELQSESRDAKDKLEASRALIAAFRQRSDLASALRVVLEQLDAPNVGEVEVTDRPDTVPQSEPAGGLRGAFRPARRVVRSDRWQQAVIADLLAEVDRSGSANERSVRVDPAVKLRAMLDQRKEQAAESADPFALALLGEHLGALPLGKQIRLQLAGRMGSGGGFVKTSLALREIAASHDRTLAAEAWYRLALLHEFRSEPLEAADAYRELHERFADVKLADGRAVADWLADVPAESAIGRALSKGARDPWPVAEPTVSRTEETHDDLQFRDITIETEEPAWRRMSVAIEWQGRKLRFHGMQQRGVWDLPLPASRSIWRHVDEMHKAWGVGPLLVLQVGAELFGVQPLDDRGEANARVLWSLPVYIEADSFGAEFRPARIGFSVDDLSRIDPHAQPVLEVVHVGPGLILYRSRESLTAIEPATGIVLWRRHGLRPRTRASADHAIVIVEQPDAEAIEVLRSFDGQPLAWRTTTEQLGTELMTQGRLRVRSLSAGTAVDATTSASSLIVEELTSGKSLWRRELPVGAKPFRVDHERLGVLEATGKVTFLALIDGRELARQQIDVPTKLRHLHLIADSHRLWLIVSGPETEAAWLILNQDRRGYRRLQVNGWLHSFDHDSLGKLISIPLQHVPVVIDQPPDLPFWTLAYKRPSADGGESPDGVLHLIDKRTGRELFLETGGPNLTNFGLDPRPADGVVDLLTKPHRIRFDFAK